jgi:hypothetical protein
LWKARAARLWNAHGAAWRKAAEERYGKGVSRLFGTGLPEVAEIDRKPVEAKDAAKALGPPLAEVRIDVPGKSLGPLLALPQIARVRALSVRLGDPGAAQALASARLPALRRLRIDTSPVLREDIGGLFLAPFIDQLEELKIIDQGEAAQELLTSRARPPGLRRLILYWPILTGEGPARLVSADWAGLTELHIDGVNLRDAGTAGVYDSPHLGTLEALRVTATTNDHSAALLANPAMTRLRELRLDGIATGDGKALIEAMWRLDWPALRYLSLWGNPHPAVGGALAKCPSSPRLVGLDICLQLRNAGVQALARGDFASLRWLGLGGGRMGPNGLKALLAARWARRLEYLDLSGNDLNPPAARLLLTAGPFPELRVLRLDDNHELGEEGVSALFSSEAFPALRVLHLARTNAGEQAMRALAESPLAGRLEVLTLDGNYELPERVPLALAGRCPSLQAVSWDITDRGARARKRINAAFGEGAFDFTPRQEY